MNKEVYFAHPMEGLQIPEESGQRAFEARRLLGENYTVHIPEEWQEGFEGRTDLQEIDLLHLMKSDIVLVDFYKMGLLRGDATVLGRGTNQEVGFAKGWNYVIEILEKYLKRELLSFFKLNKKVIIQVIRQHSEENIHPFDKEDDYLHNFNSLEAACDYIEGNY